MEETKFEDRRIFARLKVQFPLSYLDLKENQPGEAQVRDISAKGIGLMTTRDLTSGTYLEMWLEIPDKGEPLYTRGEVVWSQSQGTNQYRVGVNLEKADLMGLSRVLRMG